jgi:Holliday junction resolvase
VNSRGISRERQVRAVLEGEDWWVARAAGSLGDADLVALRYSSRPRLIEVKSTIGPYDHFPPAARRRLSFAATLADADAWLAWWPKHGKLRWIHEAEWPPAHVPQPELEVS